MKKIFAAAVAMFAASLSLFADDDVSKINVAMDMRADFTYDDVHGEKSSSGIHGRYFNLMVNGNITKNLSYNWRQRLNKLGDYANDVFAATDWIYLDWKATNHFSFSAGKQVVLIGGYEYDAAPIDIFFSSVFWNNIACYQFGVSGTYTTSNGRHALTFQACNSPYQKIGSSCYAYNLYWSGRMGCYKTLWSANVMEYERGHYATFFALGNRFDFGPVSLEIDYMNRATPHHRYLLADYTLIGKAEYAVLPWLTLMAKGGKDKFQDMPGAPEHLDKAFYGGGLEFFPYKGHRDLRIHAMYHHNHHNDGTAYNELMIGLKWRVNLFRR